MNRKDTRQGSAHADSVAVTVEVICTVTATAERNRGVIQQASDGPENKAYTFLTSDSVIKSVKACQPGHGVKKKDLVVDTGATSHIITDIVKFKKVDWSFHCETHCEELADGAEE